MSVTFEFSFNATIEFSLLVAQVNRALGTALQRDGSAASGILLGTALVLEQHDMTNDRELDFRDYRYQLWNKTWDGAALRSCQLETLVIAAFVLHSELGIKDGMLTYEGQRLLARYEIIAGRWSDAAAGAVVDVLDHIIELQRRLDDSVG